MSAPKSVAIPASTLTYLVSVCNTVEDKMKQIPKDFAENRQRIEKLEQSLEAAAKCIRHLMDTNRKLTERLNHVTNRIVDVQVQPSTKIVFLTPKQLADDSLWLPDEFTTQIHAGALTCVSSTRAIDDQVDGDGFPRSVLADVQWECCADNCGKALTGDSGYRISGPRDGILFGGVIYVPNALSCDNETCRTRVNNAVFERLYEMYTVSDATRRQLELPSTCGNCRKPSSSQDWKKCGACLHTHYCSDKCQLSDRARHKITCKQFKRIRAKRNMKQ